MSLFIRSLFLLSLLSFSLLCSGNRHHHNHHHARQHDGTHSFPKRQDASNTSQVDADMQPLPAANMSFFENAPENFFMRQPWSAENVTEATFRRTFAPALDLVTTTAATSNDYTCSASKPCRDNAACCNGVTGQCGFGPKYCGSDVCISDCQSKSECGQYAAEGKEQCPLKVCCSEFGYCGVTSEFCGKGCQNNCDDPKPSGRRAKDPRSRVIAYYEAWSSSKACGNMEPEDIPVDGLTHLNFAFGYVSPNKYDIVPMDDRTPEDMFTRVTSAKERNPDLKVFVALGGWTFSDNDTQWQAVFPTMVKTRPARSRFITNLMSFMSQYGFDGVDIDWEYPSAGDRGGTPDDTKNFVLLVQEMRSAFDGEGKGWGITFTVPTSYWYLRWFDVPGMAKYVDWINVMSYDLHGVWDKTNPIGSIVNPHTNLTEIDEALKLLWRVGIEPEKIVLGLAFYGRSFQLADSSCTKPSCPFAGPAAKGICTGEGGILSYMEIQNILDRTKAKPTYDKTAGVQYVVFNGNQWVSYDDVKTIQQKIEFAKDKGLSGLMTWAIDLDDNKSTLLKAMAGYSFETSKWSNKAALSKNSAGSSSLSSTCTVTDCHKAGVMSCPNGYLFQTYMDGFGYLSASSMKCPTGQQRSLCCPADHNPDRSQCKWSECAWPCGKGETNIISDWVGDNPNKGCSPRTGMNHRNYCCKVDNMKQYYESCQWTACGKDPKCGQGNQKDYTETLSTGYGWTEGLPSLCPSEFCQFAEQCNAKSAKFCCKPKKVGSCTWRGTPNSSGISSSRDKCDGNICRPGEIVFDRATAGDDPEKPCFTDSPKVLCCTPGDDADENFDIDPAHLVPQDLREGSNIKVGSHISSSTPKTADFFTFMSVIGNKEDVVSLDKRDGSHLEFFDCSPGTGLQTAKVVCSNTTAESNCNDIHEGGLWGTVVRLPEGCGRSRWARAISLTEAADQTLPGHLKKRGMPSEAKIQELTFDYDFKNLKRASSKIAFRIDQSNLDNYWANIVDSAAKRDESSVDYREREELRAFFANQTDESGLHEKIPHQLYSRHYKRWYGDDAGEFAQKATSGDAGGFGGAFDVTLADFNYGLREELKCEYGGSKYTAVAEINTVGKVTGQIKFGATMYGELWPNFSFRKSYIHMRGSLKGDFALDVTSDNVWDYKTNNMEFMKPFAIPKTSYEIDGIGEIFLYAGARGTASAKGEWSGNINIPWKWQTDAITITVPSNAKVEDSADYEKTGLSAGTTITPRYALGNDKLQMTVSIKPYIGLGFGVGAGDPKKQSSDFTAIAGLEMETETRSIIEVVHNSDLKESCINVYGQVGANGVAISPLAGWLLGKDRTEYALYHSSLTEIHKQCFPTGEIGKRSLPRGLAITSDTDLSVGLAKRGKDFTCRSEKGTPESDTDCSKCLIDNGFAADLTPPDQVYDTDLCDLAKRSDDEEPPQKRLAIFLRNETTIDNATAHSHLDKRAVTVSKIDKCRLQWSSAKYDSCSAFQKKTGKYYYDEYNPKSCTDFRTWPWPASQRTQKGQYATEHVFELNFIKEFLEFLRNQVYHDEVKEASVYKGFSCSDLTDTFFLGTTGKRNIDLVMNELGNRDKTDRLAVLFKDINGMKYRALARDGKASIVAQSTWDKSTWRERYSQLKRAGGVAHYMRTSEITKMFVDTSNGVYDAMGKADGSNWKLSARYALWMDHLIKAYNEGLKDFMKKRSQELYDAHQAGSATGYSTSEVNNLQRMAQNGNPNFDMWWSPTGLKK